MTTFAVIVNYMTANQLADCVESLRGEPIDRILVGNNSSRPEEVRILAAIALNNPSVELHDWGQNIGFGAAVNRLLNGLALGDSDKVWILNPDTKLLHAGSVSRLMEPIDSGILDIASPVLVTGDHPYVIWYAGADLDVRKMVTPHTDYGLPLSGDLTGIHKATFVTGAAMALSGAAWKRLGGFREDLFLYYEDADMCRRGTELGMVMGVVMDVQIWHQVGGASSAEGKSSLYYYYMQRNRLLLAGSLGRRVKIAGGVGLGVTLRLLVRAARETVGRRAKMWACVRGLFDGLTARSGPNATAG